jgi:hypothetical protein
MLEQSLENLVIIGEVKHTLVLSAEVIVQIKNELQLRWHADLVLSSLHVVGDKVINSGPAIHRLLRH